MASIGNDSNGHRRILFVAGDGTRKTIRLGAMSKSQAQTIKTKVEDLIGADKSGGAVKDETAQWLKDRDDVLHARLAAVDLVKARTGGRAVLGAFIDGYIAGRPALKPATVIGLKQVRRYLVNHFGEHRDMRTIEADDAESFREGLVKLGLGDNTIRRTIGAKPAVLESRDPPRAGLRRESI